MQFIEEAGVRFIEGHAGQPLMKSIKDSGLVVEACFSAKTDCALLYPENLTAAFFDLSSGEAGEILQKFRNYRIRLAVVCAPGSVRFSSRFRDMAAEEARGRHFGVFETRQAAQEWLSR
jgi:Domain of unknown function (DUF4180)